MPDQGWYLDIEGHRSGPFPLEQIRGLLDDGEILPEHHVVSEFDSNVRYTVADLLTIQKAKNPPPPVEKGEILPTPASTVHEGKRRLPSRPPGLEKTAPHLTEPTHADTAEDLFDTLQTAKEKKKAKSQPPPADPYLTEEIEAKTGDGFLSRLHWDEVIPTTEAGKKRAVLVASGAAIVGLGVWAATSLLGGKNSPEKTAAPRKQTPPPAASRQQPSAAPQRPAVPAPPPPAATAETSSPSPPRQEETDPEKQRWLEDRRRVIEQARRAREVEAAERQRRQEEMAREREYQRQQQQQQQQQRPSSPSAQGAAPPPSGSWGQPTIEPPRDYVDPGAPPPPPDYAPEDAYGEPPPFEPAPNGEYDPMAPPPDAGNQPPAPPEPPSPEELEFFE